MEKIKRNVGIVDASYLKTMSPDEIEERLDELKHGKVASMQDIADKVDEIVDWINKVEIFIDAENKK